MTIEGIDISAHQDTTPSLEGKAFVILRASIGDRLDLRYGQHWVAARAAGIPTMAYHYGFPADRTPIADQVAVFLSAAAAADYLFLDQEEQGFTDAQAADFIARVRASGRECGLYHSSSGFGGVPNDLKWVADWRSASVTYPRTADGSKEFPGWAVWQYNGAGADGIDNDRWNPAIPLPKARYVTAEVVDQLQAALAAAPGIEKERIALAAGEAAAAKVRAL